jgi:dTDP-4-amino-4,6-dideoxygalactose transaminase
MSISRFDSIPRFALPYTPADFAAGLQAIFRDSPPPDAFGFLGDAPRFWTRSGRQALRLLLGALDLKPASGIAIPLFTDPSLFRAVAAAGHRPVFIDVDSRFLTIHPQSLKDARGTFSAVVAVHLFGQTADMTAILEAAGDVPVIEDAAHAPLSFLNGRMAGGFGAAGFYSFASTKYWPSGGGGLAVVNDARLAEKLAQTVRTLSPPSRARELRDLVLQATKAAVFHRRLYGICGRPMRRWVERFALLEPCLDLKAIQRSWAAVACRQALRLPQRVERQRANSFRLLARLRDFRDLVLPWERPGAQYNYHLFPVLLRNSGERTAMMAAMWARFVDTSMIYSGVVNEARRFGYQGNCPLAESVAERLITLPNYASLTGQDVDNVAQVFLSSLTAFRRAGSEPAPRAELTPAGSNF